MCTFGVLGLSCEALAAQSGPKPPGFHTTTREPKRAHLRVLAFKNHQNSTRRPPEREEKNEFCGGRGKKKSEILGGPAAGGPAEGGPAEALNTHSPHTAHNTEQHTATHTQHTTNKQSHYLLELFLDFSEEAVLSCSICASHGS